MGWLRRSASSTPAVAQDQALASLIEQINARAWRVNRATAMQVPAVSRALGLIKGTVSGLPLRQYRVDLDTGAESRIEGRSWLDEPNDRITAQKLIADTVDDLVLHGVAYWEVRAQDFAGRPLNVALLPAADVTEDPGGLPQDPDLRHVPIHYRGRRVPATGYLRFDSPLDGVLSIGAETIATAAALTGAMRRGAEAPLPNIILKNTGADLPASQVKALVDAWAAARSEGAVGYLSSVLDVVQTGYSNRDQELTAALNESTLQIARLFNLDAWWLAGSVTGSSLTYQNRVDAMRALVELACGPYMKAIGERLSKDDVTAHGRVVRFDSTDLLRDNPAQASQILATLHPTGLLSLGEARDLLGLPTYRKGKPWMPAPASSSSAPPSMTSTPDRPALPGSPSPTGSAPASATG